MSDCKKVITALSLVCLVVTGTNTANKVRNGLYNKDFYSLYNVDIIDDNSSVLSSRYDSYTNRIINEDIPIPYEEDMVPQGITKYNDYLLISSYSYYNNNNSIVTVLDKGGKIIHTAMLPNSAHVGGICFDKKNNLIWVTSTNGTIDGYIPDDIINKEYPLPKYDAVNVGDGLVGNGDYSGKKVSYITYYDGDIFVGNFVTKGNGLVKRYNITIKDDDLVLKEKQRFKVPTKVQGITFYNKDDKEYILFSRSYSTYLSSFIHIFQYDENITDYNALELPSIGFEAPPMMEQITIYNNDLYALYESNADPYKYRALDINDSIDVIATDELIKPLELKLKRED